MKSYIIKMEIYATIEAETETKAMDKAIAMESPSIWVNDATIESEIDIDPNEHIIIEVVKD